MIETKNMNNAWAIGRIIGGQLLHVHFDEKNGYFFKVGVKGACIFAKEDAESCIKALFGENTGCCLLKLPLDEKCTSLGKFSTVGIDNMLKHQKKREKKNKKKKRQKELRQAQGPQVLDEVAVAPC